MDSFPGFDKLYKISSKMNRRALVVTPEDKNIIEQGRYLLRGEYTPASPIKFIPFRGGNTTYDLLEANCRGFYLFSERVINILVKNNFTGWRAVPAIVYGRDGQEIKGYCGLSITGRCGNTDNSLAEEKLISHPVGTRERLQLVGLYFDPKTWDGSDIFLIKGTACIIITEDIKIAFEKEKITNIQYKKLTEYIHA